MSIPIWGLLQRALDNPQTIDQAIAAAIVAHEEEPTAHLGAGESLQAHKNDNIIDHPQGSVLGDKYTNREFTVMPTFSSFDHGYTRSAAGLSYSLAGVRMQTGGTINTTRLIRASGQFSPAYFDALKETTFQYTARMINTTSYRAYGVAGTDGELEVGPGLGFKFENNVLLAVEIYVDINGDPQEVTEVIAGYTITARHLYRVHLTSAGVATFYVDGDEVARWTVTASSDFGLTLFTFQMRNLVAMNRSAIFSGPYLSIAIA